MARSLEGWVGAFYGFFPVGIRVVDMQDINPVYAQTFEALFQGAHDAVVAEVEYWFERGRIVKDGSIALAVVAGD